MSMGSNNKKNKIAMDDKRIAALSKSAKSVDNLTSGAIEMVFAWS